MDEIWRFWDGILGRRAMVKHPKGHSHVRFPRTTRSNSIPILNSILMQLIFTWLNSWTQEISSIWTGFAINFNSWVRFNLRQQVTEAKRAMERVRNFDWNLGIFCDILAYLTDIFDSSSAKLRKRRGWRSVPKRHFCLQERHFFLFFVEENRTF